MQSEFPASPQEESSSRPAERRAGPPVVTSMSRDSGYRSAGVGSAEKGTFGSPYSARVPAATRTGSGYSREDVQQSAGPAGDVRYPPARTSLAASAGRGSSSAPQQARTSTQQALAELTAQQFPAQARSTGANLGGQTTVLQSARQDVPPVIASPTGDAAQPRANVSSFPHTFQRWEDLSAHWEGMTSYWLRKLELHADEIGNDLTMKQLSHHVTDLSQAGGNLFHAVVELQRLRASAERKFQRWFFDARREQALAQDEIQRLHDELDAERLVGTGATARADLDRRLDESNIVIYDLNHRNAELKRELQIAKEEARRAWEELGRREQEERDRQLSLREGHPIYIGGVQVQPMQGSVSRGPSTREGPYQAVSPIGPGQMDPAYGTYDPQQPSPTNSDPYAGTQPQPRTQSGTQYLPYNPEILQSPLQDFSNRGIPQLTAAAQAGHSRSYSGSSLPTANQASSSRFYQQPVSYLHQGQELPSVSGSQNYPVEARGSYRENDKLERDEYGTLRLDKEGRDRGSGSTAYRYSHLSREGQGEHDEDDDEEGDLPIFEAPEQIAQFGRIHSRNASNVSNRSGPILTTTGPPASQPRSLPEPSVDYQSEGPGESAGWESQTRFQQHNTRLSDVVEEPDDMRTYTPGVRHRA